MRETDLQPLLAFLEHNRYPTVPCLVAIDGGSASGKTSLAARLERLFPCTVIHADDFFLRPEQRTPERYAEPGGNLDRERLIEEVLLPASRGDVIALRRLDCKTLSLTDPVHLQPQQLVLIEGAYSFHPELRKFYSFSTFLQVDPAVQLRHLQNRNTPEEVRRFVDLWIPLEERYFETFQVADQCDCVIPIYE